MSDEWKEWLKQCAEHRVETQKTEHAMIDEFAKAIMTLSAGAIGVSITFAKDVIKLENIKHPGLMLGAWCFWIFALAFTVVGYYTSHIANQKAVAHMDQMLKEKRYSELGKGSETLFNRLTRWLSPIAGILFFVGLISIACFVNYNFTYGRASVSTSTTNAVAASLSTSTTATTIQSTARTNTEPTGRSGAATQSPR